MKTVSAAFRNMLDTSQSLVRADLYTFTLASGDVLRWTDAQQNVIYDGNTYIAAFRDPEPGLTRGTTKTSIGLNSDSLEIDIAFDDATLILGESPAAFAQAGGFDNAQVRVDVALAPDWSSPVVNGVVNLFVGLVGSMQVQAAEIKLTVDSLLRILNTTFPVNYFLPQDNNALFSPSNGLSASNYAINCAVATTGGAPTATTFSSNATQADGWFSLGYIVWTSGANKGLTSWVKSYSATNGAFTLAYPITPPASGDTFTAYPGYDRTMATAQSKFNNLANFRGYPFVPNPYALELGQAGSPPAQSGGGAGAGIAGNPRGPGGQKARFQLK